MTGITNLIGQRFGMLVVEGFVARKEAHYFWLCQCDCGAKTTVRSDKLKAGLTHSCGKHPRVRLKHGCARHHGRALEYSVWSAMKDRCQNSANRRFAHYGGRGIKVCERWLSFANFLEDMGPKPTSSHSIDRINNDGHYEPGNCRWATAHEQAVNRQRTLVVEYKGCRKPLATLCRELGQNYAIVRGRIYKGGWGIERAFSEPLDMSKSHRSSRIRHGGQSAGLI